MGGVDRLFKIYIGGRVITINVIRAEMTVNFTKLVKIVLSIKEVVN